LSNELLDKAELPQISLVIPLLNESESLAELIKRIHDAVSDHYHYEIIFVDDGSTDDSWDVIKNLAQDRDYIHGIKFRRNYGKSTALQKGFERARGNYVVTMDADLQDDPFEIPEMITMLKEGYELVSGWKKQRYDPITKTIPSRFFNFVTSLVTGIKLHDFNCGLKAYRKEVLDSIYLYGEMHRYVPLLANWEGFDKIGEKVVHHHPRKYGESKFGISRFIKGFLDLVTLVFVNTFNQRPMHFFGTLGTLFLGIGGIITVYLAILKIFFHEYLSRRPLLIFGVLFLVLGVQFFSIGFLGEMVSRNQPDRHPVNIRDQI